MLMRQNKDIEILINLIQMNNKYFLYIYFIFRSFQKLARKFTNLILFI